MSLTPRSTEPLPAPTLRLYQLPAAFREMDILLDESGGEITPEIAAQLDQLGRTLETKVASIVALLQEWRLAGDAAATETKRLSDLAASRHRAADRLQGYLLDQLRAMGQDRVQTPTCSVSVCPNSRPSIRWTRDPDKLPEGYRRVSVTPDGQAAYEAYRRGEPLPEGFEVIQGYHLRIR